MAVTKNLVNIGDASITGNLNVNGEVHGGSAGFAYGSSKGALSEYKILFVYSDSIVTNLYFYPDYDKDNSVCLMSDSNYNYAHGIVNVNEIDNGLSMHMNLTFNALDNGYTWADITALSRCDAYDENIISKCTLSIRNKNTGVSLIEKENVRYKLTICKWVGFDPTEGLGKYSTTFMIDIYLDEKDKEMSEGEFISLKSIIDDTHTHPNLYEITIFSIPPYNNNI